MAGKARGVPSKRLTPISRGDGIEVRRSRLHGLGVFATAPFKPGDVIERCPVLVIDPEDADSLASGSLYGHVYDWGEGHAAVALGYGSLYNHDPVPNAEYSASDDGEELVVKAKAVIQPGDEILVDYTGGGQIELWFDPRPARPARATGSASRSRLRR